MLDGRQEGEIAAEWAGAEHRERRIPLFPEVGGVPEAARGREQEVGVAFAADLVAGGAARIGHAHSEKRHGRFHIGLLAGRSCRDGHRPQFLPDALNEVVDAVHCGEMRLRRRRDRPGFRPPTLPTRP